MVYAVSSGSSMWFDRRQNIKPESVWFLSWKERAVSSYFYFSYSGLVEVIR